MSPSFAGVNWVFRAPGADPSTLEQADSWLPSLSAQTWNSLLRVANQLPAVSFAPKQQSPIQLGHASVTDARTTGPGPSQGGGTASQPGEFAELTTRASNPQPDTVAATVASTVIAPSSPRSHTDTQDQASPRVVGPAGKRTKPSQTSEQFLRQQIRKARKSSEAAKGRAAKAAASDAAGSAGKPEPKGRGDHEPAQPDQASPTAQPPRGQQSPASAAVRCLLQQQQALEASAQAAAHTGAAPMAVDLLPAALDCSDDEAARVMDEMLFDWALDEGVLTSADLLPPDDQPPASDHPQPAGLPSAAAAAATAPDSVPVEGNNTAALNTAAAHVVSTSSMRPLGSQPVGTTHLTTQLLNTHLTTTTTTTTFVRSHAPKKKAPPAPAPAAVSDDQTHDMLVGGDEDEELMAVVQPVVQRAVAAQYVGPLAAAPPHKRVEHTVHTPAVATHHVPTGAELLEQQASALNQAKVLAQQLERQRLGLDKLPHSPHKPRAAGAPPGVQLRPAHPAAAHAPPTGQGHQLTSDVAGSCQGQAGVQGRQTRPADPRHTRRGTAAAAAAAAAAAGGFAGGDESDAGQLHASICDVDPGAGQLAVPAPRQQRQDTHSGVAVAAGRVVGQSAPDAVINQVLTQLAQSNPSTLRTVQRFNRSHDVPEAQPAQPAGKAGLGGAGQAGGQTGALLDYGDLYDDGGIAGKGTEQAAPRRTSAQQQQEAAVSTQMPGALQQSQVLPQPQLMPPAPSSVQGVVQGSGGTKTGMPVGQLEDEDEDAELRAIAAALATGQMKHAKQQQQGARGHQVGTSAGAVQQRGVVAAPEEDELEEEYSGGIDDLWATGLGVGLGLRLPGGSARTKMQGGAQASGAVAAAGAGLGPGSQQQLSDAGEASARGVSSAATQDEVNPGTAQASSTHDAPGKRSSHQRILSLSQGDAGAGGASVEVGLYAEIKQHAKDSRKRRRGPGAGQRRPTYDIIEKPPCKYWRYGMCERGSECRFAHDGDCATSFLPCRDVLAGRSCARTARGLPCMFNHQPGVKEPCWHLLLSGACTAINTCSYSHTFTPDQVELLKDFHQYMEKKAAKRAAAAGGGAGQVRQAGALPAVSSGGGGGGQDMEEI